MEFQEGHFISGIFNYCDRWCERCPYTNRCRLAEDERKYLEQGSHNPGDPEQLMSYVSEQFTKTRDMLEEMMREAGMDPDDIELSEAEERRIEDRRRKAKEHPLHQLSFKYFKSAHAFMDAHKEWIDSIREEAQTQPAGAEPFSLSDAIDTIRWYHTMISAKTYRALNDTLDLDIEDPIQNDSNGSAKVASISIKNSMVAWHYLMKRTPSLEDECLTHLVMLQKMLTMLDEAFPDYPKFIRPGFDEDV